MDADYKIESELNLDGLTGYRDALHRIMDELGVPGPEYPANVANAYEIARFALSGASEIEVA